MFGTFVKSKEMQEDRRCCKALEQEVDTVSTEATNSTQHEALTLLETKVDQIQSEIDGIIKSIQGDTSDADLSTKQDALSQYYGNLEKLQNTEIDAIVTKDLTTSSADLTTSSALKKELSNRTVTLLNIIEGLIKEIKNRRKRN